MALDGRATLAPSASLIQSTAQCKSPQYNAESTVQSLQHSAKMRKVVQQIHCASTHCVSANMFHKYSCVSVKAYKYEMLG